MSYFSGCGGTVIKDPAGTPLTMDITTWQYTKTRSLTKIEHSGNCTTSNYVANGTDVSGSFTAPWDDTELLDTDFAMDAGDAVTLKLNIGSSGKFYQLAVIVESLSITNDVAGAVTATCTFKGNGAVTLPVT